MHTNHRRKNKQQYPWDNRPWKVPNFKFFRAKEQHCLNQLRAGADADNMIWPSSSQHNDDVWHYD